MYQNGNVLLKNNFSIRQTLNHQSGRTHLIEITNIQFDTLFYSVSYGRTENNWCVQTSIPKISSSRPEPLIEHSTS